MLCRMRCSNNSTTATLNGHTVDDASIYEKQLKITYIFPALEGPGLGDIEIVDNVIYKITNANKDGTGTVTVTGVEVKQASVSVPATVVINGVTYKVNRIGTKAFYGDKTLQSVYIGDNVVIGAGSVVTKDIPDWCIAAGNPCRVKRMITEADKKKLFKDEEIDETAWLDIVARGFAD